jgi:hypothetical protein
VKVLTPEQMKVGAELVVVENRGEAVEPPWRGRITSVRDTHENPVDKETRRDRVMTRSRYLVVMEAVGTPPDGRKVRSFYHHFVKAVCP